MDRELQKYYEDRFSMMATTGWKDLMTDVDDLFENYNKVSNLGSNNLEFRKGQLDILIWLMSLHSVSSHTYESLSNETVL